MVLTRCSFINMSLVWLNHFGTTSASPPPKKTWKNHAPNPAPTETRLPSTSKFTVILSVQVFFWGMYFLFTTNKASPEAFSIWTPRCVSVSLNLLEKHPCRLPKYRVFKRWNPKPSKYDPKWRFGGDRSSNFEIWSVGDWTPHRQGVFPYRPLFNCEAQ